MCLSVSKQAALKLIDPGYSYLETSDRYEIGHEHVLLFYKFKSQRRWRKVTMYGFWVPIQNAILPIIGSENVATKRSSVYRA
jgi:hypothetical protein